MDKKYYNRITCDLLNWMNTWLSNEGAYNSFVVHRFDLKRMYDIHETPWGHCLIIEGLVELYQKCKDERLYRLAEKAVKLQIKQQNKDGSFEHAGFEDDRFSSLVHNALADRALLSFRKIVKNEKIKVSIDCVVKKNIENYFIGMLWSEENNAFRFSKVDYYSTSEERYVANMNAVAIEVLLMAAEVYDNSLYEDYALKCSHLIKKLAVRDVERKDFGAIGYDTTKPYYCIGIYTALALGGVLALEEKTHDNEFREIAVNAANQLVKYTKNNMFLHAIYDGKERPYPIYVAGSGMILDALYRISEKYDEFQFNLDDYLSKLEEYRLENGAYQNFVGYDTLSNYRKSKKQNEVWEEYVPCLNWNAHLFRFFTRICTSEFYWDDTAKVKRVFHRRWNYFYYESEKRLVVFSVWSLKSITFLFINKKHNKSRVAFSPMQIYKKMRGDYKK